MTEPASILSAVGNNQRHNLAAFFDKSENCACHQVRRPRRRPRIIECTFPRRKNDYTSLFSPRLLSFLFFLFLLINFARVICFTYIYYFILFVLRELASRNVNKRSVCLSVSKVTPRAGKCVPCVREDAVRGVRVGAGGLTSAAIPSRVTHYCIFRRVRRASRSVHRPARTPVCVHVRNVKARLSRAASFSGRFPTRRPISYLSHAILRGISRGISRFDPHDPNLLQTSEDIFETRPAWLRKRRLSKRIDYQSLFLYKNSYDVMFQRKE